VDGKQVGGTFTAKALHGSSQYDTLEIKGDWGVGNHTVGVKLLNDLYGGSSTTDRNVYVESANYNGSAVTGSYQFVNAADTKSFTVTDNTAIPSTTTPIPVPTPTTGQNLAVGTGSDTLTLKFTQDAWQGDSKFVVLVDGKQIGGEITGKSLHNSGVMDTLTIKGDWGVGAHSVQFKMTNDGWGGTAATDRNIHVESATYNGAAVSNSYQFVNTSDLKGFSVNDTTAIPGTTPTTPTNPTPVPVGGIKLTKVTTQIKSSFAGQVIENKDIWVDAGDAVSIIHDNVILKNCRIHHKGGDGVNISNAKNVQILNCEIINSDPPTGQNGETSSTLMNIEAFRASGLKIDNVTLRDGSSGIYVQESPGTIITNIEGYNFHGPFPRGQLVQFNQSDNSKLSGFYNYNDLKNSRTEDNVNVYHSNNVVIENGKIDGNNSPTGVGVLFEGDSSGGIVRNVDVVRMSNGAFSSYSNNVDFFDVRTFDGYNTDIGLGKSTSNGLSFNHSATGVSFDDATWTRPANSSNISWGSQAAEFLDIKQDAGAVVMDHSQWVNIWNWIL
jgi:hypothetical protein